MVVQAQRPSLFVWPWETFVNDDPDSEDRPAGWFAFCRWLGYRSGVILDDHQILQVQFADDTWIILSKYNLKGGECDCCTVSRESEVVRWRLIELT
jgi:hypothetical protein